MKKEKLEQYRNLAIEVNYLKEKLRKHKIEYDTVSGSNNEFPYEKKKIKIQGNPVFGSTYSRYLIKIKKCEKLRREIEEWIDNIPDSRVRLIFEMRYVDVKSWRCISKELRGSDESYARKIHDRFLNRKGIK